MNGTYLRDTFDELKALLLDLNLALSNEGLAELTEINDMFVKKNINKQPYMLIDMMGRRRAQPGCDDWDYEVVEDVPISMEVYIRGDQRDAILYEGIVKNYIKSQEAELRTKITDAQLAVIHPESSEITIDKERTNGDSLVVSIRFNFKFSWT